MQSKVWIQREDIHPLEDSRTQLCFLCFCSQEYSMSLALLVTVNGFKAKTCVARWIIQGFNRREKL